MLADTAYRVASAISPVWMAASSRHESLRIFAYHGVPDPERFRRQAELISSWFYPLSLEEALQWLDGARSFERPCWVTFDDGDPSIVEDGLPILKSSGIPATMFICPGLIDSVEPFWWEIVEVAIDEGISVEGRKLLDGDLARLKGMSDAERRSAVQTLRSIVEARRGAPIMRRQLVKSQLAEWLTAGHTLGNHTWDHPLLDMCTREEQIRTVDAAHRWIVREFGSSKVFAYPNGNFTPAVAEHVLELGYAGAVLFNHRLHKGGNPFQASRIRVNTDDDLDQFKAKVSGVHPWVHRALGRK